ncbi:MAG: carboxypeptidase-like regulatory domain-containing protein [Acidobacteriota bacterium]|nr:carboxypeptidase-like regulatory domain-containing protein [Acidobacteriota bacterium]
MRRLFVLAATLLGLFLAMPAFCQDASLGGTVTDSSGAVVPGAMVTATNEGTGVISTATTNTAGVYSFPRLLFGSYTVKAEQKGFQPKTYTKVPLSAGQQARLNFQLDIGGVATSVEVTTSGELLLLESSSTVGDVLPEETVKELPLVNRNALDLIKVMSGVIVSDDPIFGANNTTFAGVSASAVNVQMDGVTVNDVRFPTGINTPTRVNPDLVGEFRMVLAPVDAEVGRGNAQVQISTKSGGNQYHGNAVWNVQNTALDPNTWDNNRLGAVAPWRNLQEYTISVGGPIIKNKTFFFALFNGQVAKRREPYNAMSLTPCARRGIFRFWDRWNNGNFLYAAASSAAGGANPVIATVDGQGNPVRPQWEPNAWGTTAYTGQLRYASVFGTLLNPDSLNADCSNAQISGTWDPVRPGVDPSGFIEDFLQKLPAANNYDIGDGLNTAGFRWTRTAEGGDNLYGVGEDTYRKQINVRIDHNFSAKHRINGSWMFEKNHADDTLRTWPTNSWSGGGNRQPQVLTVNFLSNISSNILNEFKFGMSRTGSNVLTPASRPSNGDEPKKYLAQFGTLFNGEVGVVEPGSGLTGSFRTDGPGATASTPYGTRGSWAIGDLIDNSPRYSWGDTVTWVKGTHSLRFGGEFRRNSSKSKSAWLMNASFQWADSFPEYQGGELPLTPQTFSNVPEAWGANSLAGSDAGSGNKRAMRDLLIFLSGSLSQIKQARYVNTIDATSWNDPIQEPHMVRDTIMREFSLFVKDDWKIRPDLTLNLGVRWDYYGVPYLGGGMTVGLEGGGGAIFGPSGGYDHWFSPIKRGDTSSGSLVSLRSIGPSGQHSGESLYPKTWTNIGPAVGFAYELPWFGRGKTTVRGGYQLSYISMAGNFSSIQGAAGQSPGFFNINIWNNGGTWAANDYFGIKDLKTNPIFANGVPVPSTVVPGLTAFDLYDRQQSVSAFAPDYKYPYVQNLTFAVSRNVTSSLSVDLRYIGTLTRHNFSSKNINTANFLTNGLLEAFNAARAGQDPLLLDQLLNGVALTPWGCTVNGADCKGGAALRAAAFPTFNLPLLAPGWFSNLNQMLAMGNYQGLANALNVLTRSSIPGDPKGKYIEDNGFPVNFIKASPQFNSATLYENQGYSNYHSFQAQVTLRPIHGISFQSTYTWSKNLGNSGGLAADPRDLRTGYVLLDSDRPHNWVTYGTFDLPFGPNRLVGTNTHGTLARIIGGWQAGWITTVQSGAPLTLTTGTAAINTTNPANFCGLYGYCTPDIVGDGFDTSSVGVSWPHGAQAGSLFSNRYTFTADPQCLNVDPSIRSLCTLQAVVDTKTGKIVLQNPLPGKMGNMGYNTFRNLVRWNVDLSLSKAVSIDESRSFRFRVDITNAFNHPFASGTLGASGTRIKFPTAPSMNINGSTPIGQYTYKVGGRTVQAMVRFDF